MTSCPYSLVDLEQAQRELENWRSRFADDRSNNPNKYRFEISQAAGKVRDIRYSLKEAGILPRSEQELLNIELDRLYPNAKSRRVVSYLGKRYQIRYFKVGVFWEHHWQLVD